MHLRPFYLILTALAATVLLSQSVQAGGGKKRKKNDPANDMSIFYWQDSVDDALDEAATVKRPIMLVLCKSYEEADYQQVQKMTSWPYAIVGSHRDFVAARETVDKGDYKALCEKMQIKSLPVICWMDQYGNPLTIQSFPASGEILQTVPQNWKPLQDKVEKFFKDHLDRGDRYVKINKLKEGYNEYGLLAPFKGPQAEKARESKKKVKEQWDKMLALAKAAPARDRVIILRGIARETMGTDLERDMYDAVNIAMNTAGDAPKVAAAAPVSPSDASTSTVQPAQPAKADAPAGPATTEPVAPPPAVAPPPVIADIPKPAPAKPAQEKTLGDLASMSVSTAAVSASVEADDSQISSVLLGKNNPQLKEANTIIQAGIASYKKAIADTTDRGPARNAMLRMAHENLSKAMDILETATNAKADAQLDKVEQDISMMMYGCLKYQSL